MSLLRISSIVVLFQVYGVVTLKSSLSLCWSLVTIILTIDTTWTAYREGFFNIHKISTISGKTHVFAYTLLFSTRFFIIASSILNAHKFQKIVEQFKSFDECLKTTSGIEVNSKGRGRQLLLKVCIIGALAVSIHMSNIFFPKVKKHLWLLSVISVHIIHVKELSFVFFVDSLNFRLESLLAGLQIVNQTEILKLHSMLFTAAKLINDCYGIMTLTILQNYYGILVNLFWFTLIVSNLEFVVPVSRESEF